MSKIDISKQPNGGLTVPSTTAFVYRRPRSLVQHLARRPNLRYVARITKQVLVSAGFTSAGLLVVQAGGLTPITPITAFGASLAFTGVGIALGEEDTQTPEQYRQFVIEHFEARGETPPRWTGRVKQGQVWGHRGILSYFSKRRYLVISVRKGVARCLVTDVDGGPMMADGKAQTCSLRTVTMRYAYKLVGGAQ